MHAYNCVARRCRARRWWWWQSGRMCCVVQPLSTVIWPKETEESYSLCNFFLNRWLRVCASIASFSRTIPEMAKIVVAIPIIFRTQHAPSNKGESVPPFLAIIFFVHWSLSLFCRLGWCVCLPFLLHFLWMVLFIFRFWAVSCKNAIRQVNRCGMWEKN